VKEARAILLYDGDCGLCLRSVRLLVKADRAGALAYAPQQGSTAAPILARHRLVPEVIQTVVLVEDPDGPAERLWFKSDAMLRAVALAGGAWRMLAWLRVVPRPVRDGVYDFIAGRRKRWFGPASACPLPTHAQRARMLP